LSTQSAVPEIPGFTGVETNLKGRWDHQKKVAFSPEAMAVSSLPI
jgi:hypothetical protein